ncbi:MAG: CPBP family intramembrane glutamic endopeptidase [Candidatus Odinarchaeota archaeon]
MEEQKLKYYKLARYPVYEVLMEGQIASAGAHQAKLLEKFKKNNKYIKHQYLALKFVYAFLFVVLPVFPLFVFLQSAEYFNLGTYPINTIFFVSAIALLFFFGMTVLYMLMLGMVSTSSFMSGNSFKWLQTLPLSKKSLKKIGLMTIFRNLDLPLIILIAGFPIITLIATHDILIFFISIPVSIINVIFCFSILVLVGEKMSYIFSESKSKSKRASLVRTITMLGYFIMMFSTGFLFGMGINAVESLFDIFSTTEPPFILIMILSLVPFLFAPAFLVSLVNVQFQVNPILILTTLTGFALSIIITWVLFKVAQRALHSAISTEIKIKQEERREIKFEVISTSPIKAYIRKDLVSSTRDIQSFMFVFFPLFYPLIMIVSMIGLFAELTFSTEVIMILWSILLLFYLIIPIMLVIGFFNIEESGSSTVASLPLLTRDQAKAKLVIMLSIQGLSLILTSIILTFLINSLMVIILLLITLPIAWTFLLLMFLMKIKLFGQMKFKYVIEEVNKRNKPLKWIAMLCSIFAFYLTILIIGAIIMSIFNITITLIALGVIGLLGLAIMVFTFNRMFPRLEKTATYKTGGFLREHVNVATLVVLILYFIFLYVNSFTQGLAFIFLISLPPILLLFIVFFIAVGFLILLWQIAVPLGLKLPYGKQSLIQHFYSIGLTRVKPLWKNLIIGLGSFGIFVMSALLIGQLLGNYTFNPSILVSGYNWMLLFVFMLIPGIWEEIGFRGVILNLQLRKYSKISVVFFNGILFGLYHFVNILFGQEIYTTLIQVIFACLLGISLAYIYIKTYSLLACIILHYLIDAVGRIVQTFTFPNILNSVLFVIFGLGVVPMIFIVLFVFLISKVKAESISRELH